MRVVPFNIRVTLSSLVSTLWLLLLSSDVLSRFECSGLSSVSSPDCCFTLRISITFVRVKHITLNWNFVQGFPLVSYYLPIVVCYQNFAHFHQLQCILRKPIKVPMNMQIMSEEASQEIKFSFL